MISTVSTITADTTASALEIIAPRGHRSPLLHFVFGLGLFGLFFVSIVDSSFVPLPVPGLTDIMLVLMAARHNNFFLLVGISSAGSAIGGYVSYRVGQSGGMAFIERRVPPRIFKHLREWMEHHAILSVALPALLPPPMPLAPFVLAAGALKMSKNKFMTAFVISRTTRHAIAAGLGLYYGRPILRLWDKLSAEYAMPVLIVIWSVIILSCIIAIRQIYKASRSVTGPQGLEPQGKSVA
ncbi:MAG: VTT domain-containing protein [Edaphobacter sp.]|uniref:YqaA family protein n=1 Tax=Edaphobacter sp. TaxID=1934404 RepID=UPI0023912406|nr:VTT domain-containing protein [Edaphobacter sp.]MDE1177744.1 VTT domain-containing protein [Edaphobacter sp.]